MQTYWPLNEMLDEMEAWRVRRGFGDREIPPPARPPAEYVTAVVDQATRAGGSVTQALLSEYAFGYISQDEFLARAREANTPVMTQEQQADKIFADKMAEHFAARKAQGKLDMAERLMQKYQDVEDATMITFVKRLNDRDFRYGALYVAETELWYLTGKTSIGVQQEPLNLSQLVVFMLSGQPVEAVYDMTALPEAFNPADPTVKAEAITSADETRARDLDDAGATEVADAEAEPRHLRMRYGQD